MMTRKRQGSRRPIHNSNGSLMNQTRQSETLPMQLRRVRKRSRPCWRTATNAVSSCLLKTRNKRWRASYIAALVLLLWIQTTFDPFHITRWIDHRLTYHVMAQRFSQLDKELAEAGVHLPPIRIEKANNIRTNAALRVLLLNRARRKRILERLEQQALTCKRLRNCTLPRVMFIPNVAGQPRTSPAQHAAQNITTVWFDETEMRQLVAQTASINDDMVNLHNLLHARDKDQFLILWAVCAVYTYGGMAHIGPSVATEMGNMLKDVIDQPSGENSFLVTSPSDTLQLLMASPRHDFLRCFLQRLSERSLLPARELLEPLLNGQQEHHEQVQQHDPWARYVIRPSCETIEHGEDMVDTDLSSIYFRAESSRPLADNESAVRTTVNVMKTGFTTSLTRRRKQTLQEELYKRNGEPGFLCNRCLNYANFGTFERCRRVCPAAYEELICHSMPFNSTRVLPIVVRRHAERPQRIPRIVHQTWWDEISFDRYPQLARIQASWKNTGWDYRFYTDEDARQYIMDRFPSPFFEAFDALIHGAYKADLFRYLVLLMDGGVYADVDVLLETTLDTFITPTMSFFGPRDIPCEYAGGAFCIWNGFLGSEPGHPILARAVERLVNLIRSRADMYDMERDICQRNGPTTEIWKVRAQPLLFLTGPCGLGVAVNEGLARASLSTVSIGWAEDSSGSFPDHGDTLILVADKHDLGEFRFSDPERNYIVASTDINDSHRTPGAHPNRSTHIHYSNSRKYMSIWGSSGVYIDDIVADEYIRFKVSYVDS